MCVEMNIMRINR